MHDYIHWTRPRGVVAVPGRAGVVLCVLQQGLPGCCWRR
jgi:hypothetical protein